MALKLFSLRELMKQKGLDYYWVPSSDPHHNEYVPDVWQRRAWLTGFTGSAGDALIGLSDAYLWTDSRYFLQAEMQLDPQLFQLKKQIIDPPIPEWLKENAAGKKIGIDPQLITIQQAKKWQEVLQTAGCQLIFSEGNWVDAVWNDRPSLKTHPIQILDERFTGKSTQEKLKNLRQDFVKNAADAQVISTLDAIAWLFNIRGKDIEYNPLIISYAIVTAVHAVLFLDQKRLTEKDKKYFKENAIQTLDYQDFANHLAQLKGKKIWLDPTETSEWIYQKLDQKHILLKPSSITLAKALKNKVEQKNMHEAHRLDALALCRFFTWLEKNKSMAITELQAEEKLDGLRLAEPRCQSLSFSTISAFGPHGAIVHYKADEKSNIIINDQNLYLLDSGGQYCEGTTDVTRTIHLGQPTDEQKHHYTLVLKAHLALRYAVFPKGTCGEHLNVLARLPLWEEGLDFGHGTGHGVGCYLCVHEGPQRISAGYSGVALQPGMMVSNEPGLYFSNRYGIRIENVCAVIPTTFTDFYTFEDLTKVPYAKNLINISELAPQEIEWINSYHQNCYQLLHSDLSSDEQQWLKKATSPL